MSFHHYNRLINHWQPKVKPEGQSLGFGSKQRYRALTPGAVAVAQFLAQHLKAETNCYAISQKTLEVKLGLTKETIGKAQLELVAWGIFTRERGHYEKAYTYRLAIECPADCEHLDSHYTKSELATLPKKQATPLPEEQATPTPKEQATGGLKNRQLIERDREINKEMNRARSSCFNCSGDYEVLPNGSREIIHSHDCSELQRTKQGRGWNITQGELGSKWETLDNREQQIANHLSLAKGKARQAIKAELITASDLLSQQRFDKIITRTLAENDLDNYSPAILEWLGIVYGLREDITDTAINRAVDYTRRGWHLKPEGDWRKGVMINSDHFIEGEGSND